jgi:hypothetical protein
MNLYCRFIISVLLIFLLQTAGVSEDKLGVTTNDKRWKPPKYKILRTGSPILVDGRLDEPAWVAAPNMGPFHFPWYEMGQQEQTIAKILWDNQYIYIAHICQDAHITAQYLRHNDPIPEDDCMEVMLAPDPERNTFYYNIEWNLLGGYIDGHRPKGAQGPRVAWDVQGLKVAGSHVGTLNNDTDQDQYWITEVAIPLNNFYDTMRQHTLMPGDSWFLNFNRHRGQTNM